MNRILFYASATLAQGLLFAGDAAAQSASVPLNGNYVIAESGSCSPGLPDPNSQAQQIIAWLATNNFVSQGVFLPEPQTAYAAWLASLSLPPRNNFNAPITVPPQTETPVQWGGLNRTIMYGSSSAVGTFNPPIPPLAPPVFDDQSKLSSYFIVTSYTTASSVRGFYLYVYNKIMNDFFKYGTVFSQANNQSSSAAGASNGSVNGCTFMISLHQ